MARVTRYKVKFKKPPGMEGHTGPGSMTVRMAKVRNKPGQWALIGTYSWDTSAYGQKVKMEERFGDEFQFKASTWGMGRDPETGRAKGSELYARYLGPGWRERALPVEEEPEHEPVTDAEILHDAAKVDEEQRRNRDQLHRQAGYGRPFQPRVVTDEQQFAPTAVEDEPDDEGDDPPPPSVPWAT